MKKIFILIPIILILNCLTFAQEETLVGDGEMVHGGFGGPVVKFTQVKDEFALLVGGRGGWIINHTFVIGGGGYGLVMDLEAGHMFLGTRPYLNMGYGGLELEYIIHSDQLIHSSVYTLIGAGGVSYRSKEGGTLDWSGFKEDAFFVFEPTFNVEMNISSFFRLHAGLGYRFISGVKFDDLKNSDLAGPSASLTFKFGNF